MADASAFKLDILTLLAVLAFTHIVNLAYSIVMVVGRRVFPGSSSWLAGQAVVVAGSAIYFVLSSSQAPLWSLSVPNSLFYASSLLLLDSIWRFRRGRPMPRPFWLSAPCFLAAYWLLLGSPVNGRIAIFSAFMAATSAAAAALLFVGVRRELRLSHAFAGISFAVSAAVHVIRAMDAIGQAPLADFFSQRGFQEIFYLVGILSSYMMLFGYLMMSGARFELEIKEKDAEIEERNRELKRLDEANVFMMSVIAHDLRNPVGGAARYVRKHLLPLDVDPASKREAIRALSDTLTETDNLLENLLLWARERAHPDSAPRREALDLESLLRPAASIAGTAAAEKGIALSVPSTKLRVFTEREGASVVFRNLLANAVKFTPTGGSVRVEASLVDGMVEVAVTDTGRGMDEAQVALLNGGKALDSAFGTAGEKGTGLGLSLCRVFLERQGGGLRVESVRGSGSRFVVRFPAGAVGPAGSAGSAGPGGVS